MRFFDDFELHERGRCLRCLDRFRANRGERLAGVADRLVEQLYSVELDLWKFVAGERSMNAPRRSGFRQVELRHASSRDRSANDDGVQHRAGSLIRGVSGAPGDLLDRIRARNRRSHDFEVSVVVPWRRLERRILDDLRLFAAFDFDGGNRES